MLLHCTDKLRGNRVLGNTFDAIWYKIELNKCLQDCCMQGDHIIRKDLSFTYKTAFYECKDITDGPDGYFHKGKFLTNHV